jgi:phage recombination protein Bet
MTAPRQTTSGPADSPPATASSTELAPADGGFLTIRPGQRRLTEDQRAALTAVVNFDPRDRDSWPHINVFLQVCQEMGLSPWSKKLYLIKRGSGNYATHTIQTGIHGLTELAQRTGRYRKIAKMRWSGPDDDPASWWVDKSDPEDVVRRRVWEEAWIWPDRNPAAAKAVVEYYDHQGEVQQQEAIALWGMFAPYNIKREGPPGKKEIVRDPETGKPVMELADMWRKDGGAHMLMKCARAQALRMAFPDELGAVHIAEEMAAADARAAQQAMRARAEAYDRAHAHSAQDGVHAQPDVPAQDGEDDVHDAEIVHDGDMPGAHSGVHTHTPVHSEADQRAWLRAEITEICAILDRPVADLTGMLERRLRCPLDEAPPARVVEVLADLRGGVVDALRGQGRTAEADRYAEAGSERIAPVEELFGRAPVHAQPSSPAPAPEPGEPEPGGDPWETLPEVPDPSAPHVFASDGFGDAAELCAHCGAPATDTVHAGQPPPS